MPFVVGGLSLPALLALPRRNEIDLSPSAVQVPIHLHGHNIGMVYLTDPQPNAGLPDRTFWDVVYNLVSLIVERIRSRAGVAPNQHNNAPGQTGTAASLGIIGINPAMKSLLGTVEQVAPTRANVLIQGESGTGKELIARAVHSLSPRSGKPLIVINCAALPETLLEAELFGVEKGAATGVTARAGKLEQADGSTVFLDEIGDMSLTIQAKLLRVLQDHTFERLGGNRSITADFRVVAATNRDLATEVAAGKFREDLFRRLDVVTLVVPPLRERREEIPLFVEHFIRRYSEEFLRPMRALDSLAMEALLNDPWPGNVRELENVIERAVILAHGEVVTRDDFPAPLQRPNSEIPADFKQAKRAARFESSAPIEKGYLLSLLEKHDWNIPKIVREAEISRGHFYWLLDKYGIRRKTER